MLVSPDYEELFKVLNAHRVKYLVAGAHAVTYYSEPRFTKDLDIWIPPDLNDPKKVFRALKEFGAPLRGIAMEDFMNKAIILQIGIAPVRVDIMMDIPGAAPETAWKSRTRSHYGETPINILGIRDLIKAKRRAGRPQDRLDLRKLLDKIKR